MKMKKSKIPSIRQRLKDNKPVLGTWLNSASSVMAELLAECGYDFVCVDAEHSPIDLATAQSLFTSITSGNPDCEAFVRLPGIDYSYAKRYLDAGAKGLIGPLVNSPEDAALLVKTAKYPPLGDRGVGFCRANQYGKNVGDEFHKANDEILVAVQIEHIKGAERIDEILAVEGIDAVFIGPYDLSASMGLAANFEDPNYITVRDNILEACNRHNIIAGIHVVPTDLNQLELRLKEGYKMLAYSLDIEMVRKVGSEGVSSFRNLSL
ncbi:aldolase/citrate lyase family protein [Verrucomicrobia bacterium]|nr:aldolase/citrate lyase family protein [Verrucomicrobiota bacterium]MDC0324080.1 aldolase/citrate lyase family protein [Verrucomicrobiota bacterium]